VFVWDCSNGGATVRARTGAQVVRLAGRGQARGQAAALQIVRGFLSTPRLVRLGSPRRRHESGEPPSTRMALRLHPRLHDGREESVSHEPDGRPRRRGRTRLRTRVPGDGPRRARRFGPPPPPARARFGAYPRRSRPSSRPSASGPIPSSRPPLPAWPWAGTEPLPSTPISRRAVPASSPGGSFPGRRHRHPGHARRPTGGGGHPSPSRGGRGQGRRPPPGRGLRRDAARS